MISKMTTWFWVIILLAVDQITKQILMPRDFSFGFLKNHGVSNSGLSFGLSTGNLTGSVVASAGLLALGWYFFRNRPGNKIMTWSYIFVFAGGLSNLLDRVLIGSVRDHFDAGLGFVFNLADVMIFAGLACLILGLALSPAWKKGPSSDNGTKK